MLAPVATTELPDLVAGQPYYLPDREMRREMIGTIVKTAWPELVGRPYIIAAPIITGEREGLWIQELAPAEDLPYPWPSDYSRVCVKIDASTMTVYGGDPNYPYPECG